MTSRPTLEATPRPVRAVAPGASCWAAAFATGQLLGPLVVSAVDALGWPIDVALMLAAACLVTSTLLLGFIARSAVHAQEKGI